VSRLRVEKSSLERRVSSLDETRDFAAKELQVELDLQKVSSQHPNFLNSLDLNW
jgi:hypothetical protein